MNGRMTIVDNEAANFSYKRDVTESLDMILYEIRSNAPQTSVCPLYKRKNSLENFQSFTSTLYTIVRARRGAIRSDIDIS